MHKNKIKSFVITVDTEGDNLWSYKDGDTIKTENSLAIPRFQELCERYQFKPVYLTNYEMIKDNRFVDYIKDKVQKRLCEVGIHIHAWNNPPYYELENKYNGNPYLIEYPKEVMRKKFDITYNLIKEHIGVSPISHRAGRWAMNDVYFKLLKEYGIKVDCSYTPGVDWSFSAGKTMSSGSNYSNVNKNTHYVDGILELPMSIRKLHNLSADNIKSKIKTLLRGKLVWLRPAISTLEDMKLLCNEISRETSSDYLEFMVHSSELMASGSPYFKNENTINRLYNDLENLFEYISKIGYIGKTLEEYYLMYNE